MFEIVSKNNKILKKVLFICMLFVHLNAMGKPIEIESYGAFFYENKFKHQPEATFSSSIKTEYFSHKILLYNKQNRFIKALKVSEFILYTAPIDKNKLVVVTVNNIYIYDFVDDKINNIKKIEHRFSSVQEMNKFKKSISSNNKILKINDIYYNLLNLKIISDISDISTVWYKTKNFKFNFDPLQYNSAKIKSYYGNSDLELFNRECIGIFNDACSSRYYKKSCRKIFISNCKIDPSEGKGFESSPHQNILEDYDHGIVWLLTEKGFFIKTKYLLKISYHDEEEYNKIEAENINIISDDSIIINPKEQKLFVLNLSITRNKDNEIITSSYGNSIIVFDVKNNKNTIDTVLTLDQNYDQFLFLNSSRNKFLVLNNETQEGLFIGYSNKNGLKILAKLFYDIENEEYIIFTKEGYYMGNADKMLKNIYPKHAIENSSMNQYYEQFYRPDIIAKVLNGDAPQNIDRLELSNVKAAPEVTIVNTNQLINKENLKVTLKIKENYGGIGQIRLYLDGVLVKTDGDRGLKRIQDNKIVFKSYSIKLPKGKHKLKAIVYNKKNTMASHEDILTVTSTYNPIIKPNVYAVVIGVNEYKNPSIALKYAVADAKLFAKTVKERAKGLYGDVKVKLLVSKVQTSKENISKTLHALENISPNDLFIFFIASHGIIEDAKYYMITSNVGALSIRGIKKEAISQDTLRDMIANIPTTKKFIILDTCYSGALGKAMEKALLTRGLTKTTAIKVLSRAVGSTIISASSSSQEALEGYKGHGLLTYVLTNGLKGKADSDNDGYVKTLEIANFVEDRVPEIADKEFHRAQYPFVSPLGQGFPLVKLKLH